MDQNTKVVIVGAGHNRLVAARRPPVSVPHPTFRTRLPGARRPNWRYPQFGGPIARTRPVVAHPAVGLPKPSPTPCGAARAEAAMWSDIVLPL